MRSEYLTTQYLASERIDTPDPRRECYVGQQLVVQWKLAPDSLSAPTELRVTLRYGTLESETVVYPVHTHRGSWLFQLVNDDYWCHKGILSYKVDLFQEGVLIAERTHHIWSDLITFF